MAHCGSLTRACILSLACGCLVSATPAGRTGAASQNITPTFRSGVQYVEVDVRVVDAKGHAVRTLTREDFELFEDGERQAVDGFRLVDVPIPPRLPGKAPRPTPVEQDVITNAADGRVFVMLLDNAGGSPGLRTRLVARRFVDEALGPHDLMAVVHVNSLASQGQGFTSDKARLLAAIDRYRGGWEGVDPGLISASERSVATGSAYALIQTVSEHLGAADGRRKSILWIDGAPQFHHLDFRQASEAFSQRDAIRAARRNNVAIYPIDPNGLTTRMGRAELERQGGLRLMAEDTGGEAIVNTNNFSGNYRRILEQDSTYYVLGYYPAGARDDGRFHRINVKLKQPGLRVRARSGYTASRRDAALPVALSSSPLSSAADAALRSALPTGGLGLEMFLAPFKGEGSNGSVLIGAQLKGNDLHQDAAQQIEVAQVAIDMEGRAHGGSGTIYTLNVPEPQAVADGLRYFDRIALPPGRHEVRLVVHQPGGVTGSLMGEVTVPDFRKKTVTISGMVVSSLHDTHRSLSSDKEAVEALSADPTINRRFRRSDTLGVWAQLYDNRSTPTGTLALTSTIASAAGTTTVTRTRALARGTDANEGRLEYRDRFELGGLAPGDYVLTIAAPVPGARQPVTRALPFTVVSD